jgi:hypothetical protein
VRKRSSSQRDTRRRPAAATSLPFAPEFENVASGWSRPASIAADANRISWFSVHEHSESVPGSSGQYLKPRTLAWARSTSARGSRGSSPKWNSRRRMPCRTKSAQSRRAST